MARPPKNRSRKLRREMRVAILSHAHKLSRKYRFYTKNEDYFRFFRKVPDSEKTRLEAPRLFSLLENRNEVIDYFESIQRHLEAKEFSIMDMSGIARTDMPTVCMLISIMMDERNRTKNLNRYLTVRYPKPPSVAGRLFEQVQFLETVTKRGIADHNYFLSRVSTDDNSDYKLDILRQAESFFGAGEHLTTLNPILTEIMVNTNNHADPSRESGEPNMIPWFAALMPVHEEKRMCFCIVDLGVGIFENWKIKGTKQLKSGLIAETIHKTFFGSSQGGIIRKRIPEGVNSSTGLIYRGQGLKEVYDKANDGPYEKFLLLTNKATMNLLDATENIPDSEYNLEGTIFYWELKLG